MEFAFKKDMVESPALEGSKEKVWLGLAFIPASFKDCSHTSIFSRVESQKETPPNLSSILKIKIIISRFLHKR